MNGFRVRAGACHRAALGAGPLDAPRNDGRCGVLDRHCAIGKTPLLAARLCDRGFACQNAIQPE